MLPRAVGTPGNVNDPSPLVTPVTEKADTAAPPIGLPPTSTTRPVTVVSGSGITATTTAGAWLVLPPRSVASASSLMWLTPVGTVRLYSYGCELSVNTTAPSTRKLTNPTATSSTAVTRTFSVEPSMAVVPPAGSVMVTVGGTSARSSCARYCPMNNRVVPVVP